MTSAKSASEAASFHALDDAIVGATVYQDAPEDAALPVVIVAGLASLPMDSKGDDDEEVSLTIASQVDAEERAPLLKLQEQIKAILHEAVLTFDGWTLRPVWENDTADLADDGITYVGISQFKVFAFRN